MGFRRSVLKIISSFDPELGPGALGRGEEALFSSQLIEAGGRIAFARQATAIHNPGAIRLQRGEWLAMARKLGHQEAYLDYHWRHRDLRWPRLKSFWLRVKLNLRRKLQPPPSATSEGCLPWESSYVRELAMNEQFCIEQRRPRQYARRGLVKRVDDRKP